MGNDTDYFEKMVNGSEKLIKPWKLSLILTNAFWAAVLALFIALAYIIPTAYEYQYEQNQQGQQQSGSGGGNGGGG